MNKNRFPPIIIKTETEKIEEYFNVKNNLFNIIVQYNDPNIVNNIIMQITDLFKKYYPIPLAKVDEAIFLIKRQINKLYESNNFNSSLEENIKYIIPLHYGIAPINHITQFIIENKITTTITTTNKYKIINIYCNELYDTLYEYECNILGELGDWNIPYLNYDY